jgi:hypothetical protein
VTPPVAASRTNRPTLGSIGPHPMMVLHSLLGGTFRRPIDTLHAEGLTRRTPPGLVDRAREIQQHRALLLRELTSAGTARGVLDLATGLPARDVVQSAHRVLEGRQPAIPVVYVDPNAQLVSLVQELLAGEMALAAAAVCADPVDASTAWARATATGLLDPTQPVVLDCVGLTDRLPDPDRLWHTLAGWALALPPDSVLVLSLPLEPHACSPLDDAADAGWRPHPSTPPRTWGEPHPAACAVFHHPRHDLATPPGG